MYNVRKAGADDFETIFEMAHKFFQTTIHAQAGKFNVESAVDEYIQMLNSGFMLLAEMDEDAVGVIGCLVVPAPFPMDNTKTICVEKLWWVEPEYRGSRAGPMLHRAAEVAAKELGASQMVMSALSTSPAEVGDYYMKSGYVPEETLYFKELV